MRQGSSRLQAKGEATRRVAAVLSRERRGRHCLRGAALARVAGRCDAIEPRAEGLPRRVAHLSHPCLLNLLGGDADSLIERPAACGEPNDAGASVDWVRNALEIAETLERTELVVDRLLGKPGGARDIARSPSVQALESPEGEGRAGETGVTGLLDASEDLFAHDIVRKAQSGAESRG